MASYWEAVGIKTKLIGQEWAAHLARHRASKGPDAEYVCLYSGAASGAPDPTYYMTLTLDPESTHCVYSDPELGKLVREAKGTINDAKRAEIIKKIVKIAHDDVISLL
jgi:ABC-type transport system substrate-binding protein